MWDLGVSVWDRDVTREWVRIRPLPGPGSMAPSSGPSSWQCREEGKMKADYQIWEEAHRRPGRTGWAGCENRKKEHRGEPGEHREGQAAPSPGVLLREQWVFMVTPTLLDDTGHWPHTTQPGWLVPSARRA